MQQEHIQAKQISRIVGGYINISTFTIPINSSSVNIYSTLETTILTAGYKGKPIDIRISADETENGVISASPHNIVLINLTINNRKIYSDRSEVYGKLSCTEGGPYTITFYYLTIAGVETPYLFDIDTDVSLKIPYRYFLHQLPSDTIISLKSLIKGEIEGVISLIPMATDTWQDSVISIVNTPIGLTPTQGDKYLISSTPIDEFITHANEIAYYNNSTWEYIVPTNSYTIKIKNIDTVLYQYNGTYPSGLWIIQPFLTHPLGLPTEGTWTNGLFDFESTTTVDAICELNKIAKALTPTSAPELISWNELTLTPQVSGKLSFDTSLPLVGYTPADGIGVVDPVSLNDTFLTSGYRLGISSRAGDVLSGIFNYDVPQDTMLPTPSYIAQSFSKADTGNLILYINDIEIANLDLTSSVNSIDGTTGGTTTGIYVSAQSPAHFANGSELSSIQHRTGGWMVIKSDLNNGYNTIKVEHVIALGDVRTLTVFDILIDDDVTATAYSDMSFVVNSLSGIKYLSGIGYYTSGTFFYSVKISNAYKNTYNKDTDAISFSCNYGTTSPLEIPANTTGVDEQIIITNKAVTLNSNIALVNVNPTIETIVKRTVQSISNSLTSTISGILLDNLVDTNTNYQETFTSEGYRLPSNIDFDNFVNFPSNMWDSQMSIKNSINPGYGDGLQVIDGLLIYPGWSLFYPNDFRTTVLPNAPIWNDGTTKGPARNYTGLTGNRTFYRYFKQTAPTTSNFILKILGNSINFVPITETLTGNNCKVEIKASSQTGWLDCYNDFDTEMFSDGDGCRSSLLGTGRALNTNWGLTIGTKNTANTGGYIVIKITMGQQMAGNIYDIVLQFI